VRPPHRRACQFISIARVLPAALNVLGGCTRRWPGKNSPNHVRNPNILVSPSATVVRNVDGWERGMVMHRLSRIYSSYRGSDLRYLCSRWTAQDRGAAIRRVCSPVTSAGCGKRLSLVTSNRRFSNSLIQAGLNPLTATRASPRSSHRSERPPAVFLRSPALRDADWNNAHPRRQRRLLSALDGDFVNRNT